MRDLRQDPDFLRYYAQVLIGEAVARKHHQGDGSFVAFLIAGAERAKLEADEIDARKPAQGDLFAELFA